MEMVELLRCVPVTEMDSQLWIIAFYFQHSFKFSTPDNKTLYCSIFKLLFAYDLRTLFVLKNEGKSNKFSIEIHHFLRSFLLYIDCSRLLYSFQLHQTNLTPFSTNTFLFLY